MTDGRQLQLFQYSSLPSWLPGETLFSLGSRYHLRSGNRLAEGTCRQLFGTARSGLQHDFPSPVATFCERTGGIYGDPTSVTWERTLLPFYVRLRAPQEATELASLVRTGPTADLKARLGLLASGFRAHHPLKACPTCIDADRREYGVAYWHLEHQVPAVWTCPEHGGLLLECDVKANGIDRFSWVLPSERTLLRHQLPEGNAAQLRALTALAAALMWLPNQRTVEPQLVLRAYAFGLSQARLLTDQGSIRLDSIGRRYLLLCDALRRAPGFERLPRSLDQAKLQIGQILRGNRPTHPVKHLLAIRLLFGTWSDFERALESVPFKTEGLPTPATNRERRGLAADPVRFAAKREKWRRKVIDLMEQQPSLSRSQIHKAIPAAYSWLTRRDRHWLEARLPAKIPPAHRNPAIVWADRDRQLALQIRDAIPAVRARHDGQRRVRWMLYQAVPRLRPTLRQLHRLPETRAAIENFLCE